MELRGSEKQVAWAEKIIAQKKADALAAGISPEKWTKAEEIISRDGGARAWIDLRSTEPQNLLRVMAIEKMPKLTGSEKQIAYGESMRLRKITEVATMFDGNRLPELLAEMGKETSSKAWIEGDKMEMAEKAAEKLLEEAPAAADFPGAPAKSPIAGAPEPNWATLSAKEIAGKYADEMAQIVISAGETITAGLFEDAGAEFAANAAARNAGDLLRRRATQWTANHAQDIAETLAQAAETSASPHSIVEELAKEYVEHAETVARTELARVREEANLDIMRAQGAEKVQFVASEDERLCPVCGAHHGKVYDVHDAPVLPLHPNCRCTLVPYTDEEVIMSP